MTVRPETQADLSAIHEVNRLAFGQDAEANLIDGLRAGGFVQLSLVAEVGGEIVGHILFSRLPIHTETCVVEALSLAPMAMLPIYQRRGIGTKLVEEGLRLCREAGHKIVVVLGHPAFYPRFGFSAKLAEPLASQFGGGEAWMAMELAPGALAGVVGLGQPVRRTAAHGRRNQPPAGPRRVRLVDGGRPGPHERTPRPLIAARGVNGYELKGPAAVKKALEDMAKLLSEGKKFW